MKKQISIIGIKYFPPRGGASRVVKNLLEELRYDFDITLYCYKHPKAQKYMNDIDVVQFPSFFPGILGVFIYYFISALHCIFSKNYDLVHVHKTDAAFVIPLLKLKYPVVATSHELHLFNSKWEGLGHIYFHIMEHIFAKSNIAKTTISRPQIDYYLEHYNTKLTYIPNGINILSELDIKGANKIIQNLNINNHFITFAARRLIPLKGCHTLLKALQKINYKGSLLIAGESHHMPEYTRKIKKLSKGLDVHFLGYVSPLPKLLALIQISRLFVFPSEIEGMSMMLMEAVSTRTPVIASDIPQNKAVFNNDEILYFRNKKPEDLAEKIDWALSNQEKMQKYVYQAYNRVRNEYSWQKIAQKYAKLYNDIIVNNRMEN